MVSTLSRPLDREPYHRPPIFLSVVEDFDFAFAENGLTAYRLGKPLESQSFIRYIGEEKYKTLVNFILHYIADMDIPIKRYVSCKVRWNNWS
jgi:hypothetical protein